jgi:hypothetical protein
MAQLFPSIGRLCSRLLTGGVTLALLFPPLPVLGERVLQGTGASLNGNAVSLPWRSSSGRLEVGDTAALNHLGLELLSTNNSRQQPVLAPQGQKITLDASPSRQYRYLDITALAQRYNWRWQVQGNRLQLTMAGMVTDLQAPREGRNLTIALNRPLPWRLSQDATSGFLTVYGGAQAGVGQTPPAPNSPNPSPGEPGDDLNIRDTQLQVTATDRQTVIQFPIPLGSRARGVNTPTGLRIEIGPTTMAERRIAWAPGIVWHQRWQSLGAERFPISLLEVDPRRVKLRPILPAGGVVGSEPIGVLLDQNGALAAINGGYFNRNTRQPLGAVKVDGQWLSSPILGRAAIGWSPVGGGRIGTLRYQETLRNESGAVVSNALLNSGYTQGDTARYTRAWGTSYTMATPNESVLTVVAGRVTAVAVAGPERVAVAIPSNGYLVVDRGGQGWAGWSVGSRVQLGQTTGVPEFDRATHVLGAGPWLVQDRRVVVNGTAENFSPAFSTQAASRSAIGIDAQGKIQMMAIHARAGGKGPTLKELASLVQQMGWVDALNLDGGSSTSLSLGGQLVDRSPATAARVNNGLGLFVE